MTKQIDLQLSELANSAIQEKVDGELKKVFDNIHDINTEAGKKRTLTIKLTFEPSEDRSVVHMASDFAVKLAPVIGVGTTILTGKDLNNGKIEAKELKSTIPGQMYVDVDTGEVMTDVGEVVEVKEAPKLIDLQEKRG